jgi:hypothetical protein
MFSLSSPMKIHGAWVKRTVEHSLKERIDIASKWPSSSFKKALAENSTGYRIESPTHFMNFVAWLDKPMAQILDDLNIPRTWVDRVFVEQAGPTQYDEEVHGIKVRRIVPGLIKCPEGFKDLVVQPMFRFTPSLPIFTMDSWNKVNEIVAEVAASTREKNDG